MTNLKSFYSFKLVSFLILLIVFLISNINFQLYSKNVIEYQNQEDLSNYRIGEIFINSEDVFNPKSKDWFWGANFFNNLHTITQPYIIEDELLFNEDDALDIDILDETERNLRRTGLFTKVWIEFDSVNQNKYNVIINTQDKWSLEPAILYGTGGGISNYGFKIVENNLLGTWTEVSLEALYRTENNIGLQGRFDYNKKRFLRSEMNLSASISSNKFRTFQTIDFIKPYRTLSTENSYGVSLFNKNGNDFIYLSNIDSVKLIKVNEQRGNIFYSKAFFGNDRSFMTFYSSFQNVDRGRPEYRRAYDNSGQLFAVFSSVSEEYVKTNKLNTYLDEDLQIGGYGSAIIGRTFSMGNGGETLWYIAADGETSYYTGDFYMYLRAAAGSAFFSNQSKYVSQESDLISFYNFNENFLFTTRLKQQTVWRWNAMRQLILDTDTGVRGLDANQLSGDNRLISNSEFRYFPDIEIWALKFSAVAFFDIGTVWNQSNNLTDAKFYKTTGVGFRIHNMKVTGNAHIIRIDFAYNLNKNQFGGIVFGTEQYFSAFKWHIFKLPKIIGLDFDEE